MFHKFNIYRGCSDAHKTIMQISHVEEKVLECFHDAHSSQTTQLRRRKSFGIFRPLECKYAFKQNFHCLTYLSLSSVQHKSPKLLCICHLNVIGISLLKCPLFQFTKLNEERLFIFTYGKNQVINYSFYKFPSIYIFF